VLLIQTVQYQVATTTHQTDNNGESKYSNMTVYYKQYRLYKHYNLEDLEKLVQETRLFCWMDERCASGYYLTLKNVGYNHNNSDIPLQRCIYQFWATPALGKNFFSPTNVPISFYLLLNFVLHIIMLQTIGHFNFPAIVKPSKLSMISNLTLAVLSLLCLEIPQALVMKDQWHLVGWMQYCGIWGCHISDCEGNCWDVTPCSLVGR